MKNFIDNEDRNKADKIRQRICYLSLNAKSAHVGSSLSCLEIVYYLLKLKKMEIVEKLILSKGHAAMSLYAAAESLELLDKSILETYLQDGSKLWGHPSKNSEFPFIDWSTGSLGHGLSVGCGLSYYYKTQNKNSVVSVVLSDGECNEGSIWEAAMFAAHHGLNRLFVFVDSNKLQSFGTTEEVLNMEPMKEKWQSFGWNCYEVDGHSLESLAKCISEALANSKKPVCILANTVKGKGIPDIEGKLSSHYSPISPEQYRKISNNEK